MNLDALFKISHGVYLTGARDAQDRLIGSCIDAVMVVEAEPAQIMVSLNKQSYTAETVLKSRNLSLSVLSEETPDSLIQVFGTQTSRSVDKWDGQDYRLIADALPVLNQAVAVMALRVTQTWETKGHYVFLCDVVQIEPQSMAKALTYSDYQDRKRKEKKMSDTKKWVCSVCGYVYEGEVPFEELPEDWVCPLCGEPKSVFVQE